MLGWSLRFRIFLFFAALGLGGVAASGLGVWLGYQRMAEAGPEAGFVLAAVIAGLAQLGLATAIWLLFDENVAKPITGLAAGLRARTHAGVDKDVDRDAAKYLGDLAPAADAMAQQLGSATVSVAETVATETARLEAETARLTALLTEIPVATVLLNAEGQIVLYDGQAAGLLAQIAPPRLKAPISDYFDLDALDGDGGKVATRSGGQIEVQRRDMDGGGALLTLHGHVDAPARPLVYDFDLMSVSGDQDLSTLSYCVVDTETTGLDPERDALVQIAAIRLVNGRVLETETLCSHVDPGRPIPPASTQVHGICDADVVGAPPPDKAAGTLRQFCGTDVFVAHNAPFDLGLLRATGVSWQVPVLDTVLLSAVIWGTTETHTLDALCDRLGVVIPPEDRHTALGDARATAEVLARLIPLLAAQGITRFDDLVEACRKHGRLIEDMNAA